MFEYTIAMPVSKRAMHQVNTKEGVVLQLKILDDDNAIVEQGNVELDDSGVTTTLKMVSLTLARKGVSGASIEVRFNFDESGPASAEASVSLEQLQTLYAAGQIPGIDMFAADDQDLEVSGFYYFKPGINGASEGQLFLTHSDIRLSYIDVPKNLEIISLQGGDHSLRMTAALQSHAPIIDFPNGKPLLVLANSTTDSRGYALELDVTIISLAPQPELYQDSDGNDKKWVPKRWVIEAEIGGKDENSLHLLENDRHYSVWFQCKNEVGLSLWSDPVTGVSGNKAPKLHFVPDSKTGHRAGGVKKTNGFGNNGARSLLMQQYEASKLGPDSEWESASISYYVEEARQTGNNDLADALLKINYLDDARRTKQERYILWKTATSLSSGEKPKGIIGIGLNSEIETVKQISLAETNVNAEDDCSTEVCVHLHETAATLVAGIEDYTLDMQSRKTTIELWVADELDKQEVLESNLSLLKNELAKIASSDSTYAPKLLEVQAAEVEIVSHKARRQNNTAYYVGRELTELEMETALQKRPESSADYKHGVLIDNVYVPDEWFNNSDGFYGKVEVRVRVVQESQYLNNGTIKVAVVPGVGSDRLMVHSPAGSIAREIGRVAQLDSEIAAKNIELASATASNDTDAINNLTVVISNLESAKQEVSLKQPAHSSHTHIDDILRVTSLLSAGSYDTGAISELSSDMSMTTYVHVIKNKQATWLDMIGTEEQVTRAPIKRTTTQPPYLETETDFMFNEFVGDGKTINSLGDLVIGDQVFVKIRVSTPDPNGTRLTKGDDSILDIPVRLYDDDLRMFTIINALLAQTSNDDHTTYGMAKTMNDSTTTTRNVSSYYEFNLQLNVPGTTLIDYQRAYIYGTGLGLQSVELTLERTSNPTDPNLDGTGASHKWTATDAEMYLGSDTTFNIASSGVATISGVSLSTIPGNIVADQITGDLGYIITVKGLDNVVVRDTDEKTPIFFGDHRFKIKSTYVAPTLGPEYASFSDVVSTFYTNSSRYFEDATLDADVNVDELESTAHQGVYLKTLSKFTPGSQALVVCGSTHGSRMRGSDYHRDYLPLDYDGGADLKLIIFIRNGSTGLEEQQVINVTRLTDIEDNWRFCQAIAIPSGYSVVIRDPPVDPDTGQLMGMDLDLIATLNPVDTLSNFVAYQKLVDIADIENQDHPLYSRALSDEKVVALMDFKELAKMMGSTQDVDLTFDELLSNEAIISEDDRPKVFDLSFGTSIGALQNKKDLFVKFSEASDRATIISGLTEDSTAVFLTSDLMTNSVEAAAILGFMNKDSERDFERHLAMLDVVVGSRVQHGTILDLVGNQELIDDAFIYFENKYGKAAVIPEAERGENTFLWLLKDVSESTRLLGLDALWLSLTNSGVTEKDAEWRIRKYLEYANDTALISLAITQDKEWAPYTATGRNTVKEMLLEVDGDSSIDLLTLSSPMTISSDTSLVDNKAIVSFKMIEQARVKEVKLKYHTDATDIVLQPKNAEAMQFEINMYGGVPVTVTLVIESEAERKGMNRERISSELTQDITLESNLTWNKVPVIKSVSSSLSSEELVLQNNIYSSHLDNADSAVNITVETESKVVQVQLRDLSNNIVHSMPVAGPHSVESADTQFIFNLTDVAVSTTKYKIFVISAINEETVSSEARELNITRALNDNTTLLAVAKADGSESNVLENIAPTDTSISGVSVKTYTLTDLSSGTKDLSFTLSPDELDPNHKSKVRLYNISDQPPTQLPTQPVGTATPGAARNITVSDIATTNKYLFVEVQAEDGISAWYQFIIARESSSDKTLSEVLMNNSAIANSVTVEFNVDIVNLTVSTSDSNASVQTSGTGWVATENGKYSQEVELYMIGANNVDVIVIAENGTTATQTIEINRSANNSADLAISTGNGDPNTPVESLVLLNDNTFKKIVPYEDSSAEITINAAVGATVKYRSAADLEYVPLDSTELVADLESRKSEPGTEGTSNVFEFQVTSQDNTEVAEYRLTIIRESSNDSSLGFTEASVDYSFEEGNTQTVKTVNLDANGKVNLPSTAEDNVALDLNDTQSISQQASVISVKLGDQVLDKNVSDSKYHISVKPGETINLNVEIEAGDLSKTIHTVAVSKEPRNVAQLTGLKVNNNTLAILGENQTHLATNIDSSANNILLELEFEDSYATAELYIDNNKSDFTINPTNPAITIPEQDIPDYGESKIYNIKSISQSGTESIIYTLDVKRTESDDVSLEKLELSTSSETSSDNIVVVWDASSNSKTVTYILDEGVDHVAIIPTLPSDSTAHVKVKVTGSEDNHTIATTPVDSKTVYPAGGVRYNPQKYGGRVEFDVEVVAQNGSTTANWLVRAFRSGPLDLKSLTITDTSGATIKTFNYNELVSHELLAELTDASNPLEVLSKINAVKFNATPYETSQKSIQISVKMSETESYKTLDANESFSLQNIGETDTIYIKTSQPEPGTDSQTYTITLRRSPLMELKKYAVGTNVYDISSSMYNANGAIDLGEGNEESQQVAYNPLGSSATWSLYLKLTPTPDSLTDFINKYMIIPDGDNITTSSQAVFETKDGEDLIKVDVTLNNINASEVTDEHFIKIKSGGADPEQVINLKANMLSESILETVKIGAISFDDISTNSDSPTPIIIPAMTSDDNKVSVEVSATHNSIIEYKRDAEAEYTTANQEDHSIPVDQTSESHTLVKITVTPAVGTGKVYYAKLEREPDTNNFLENLTVKYADDNTDLIDFQKSGAPQYHFIKQSDKTSINIIATPSSSVSNVAIIHGDTTIDNSNNVNITLSSNTTEELRVRVTPQSSSQLPRVYTIYAVKEQPNTIAKIEIEEYELDNANDYAASSYKSSTVVVENGQTLPTLSVDTRTAAIKAKVILTGTDDGDRSVKVNNVLLDEYSEYIPLQPTNTNVTFDVQNIITETVSNYNLSITRSLSQDTNIVFNLTDSSNNILAESNNVYYVSTGSESITFNYSNVVSGAIVSVGVGGELSTLTTSSKSFDLPLSQPLYIRVQAPYGNIETTTVSVVQVGTGKLSSDSVVIKSTGGDQDVLLKSLDEITDASTLYLSPIRINESSKVTISGLTPEASTASVQWAYKTVDGDYSWQSVETTLDFPQTDNNTKTIVVRALEENGIYHTDFYRYFKVAREKYTDDKLGYFRVTSSRGTNMWSLDTDNIVTNGNDINSSFRLDGYALTNDSYSVFIAAPQSAFVESSASVTIRNSTVQNISNTTTPLSITTSGISIGPMTFEYGDTIDIDVDVNTQEGSQKYTLSIKAAGDATLSSLSVDGYMTKATENLLSTNSGGIVEISVPFEEHRKLFTVKAKLKYQHAGGSVWFDNVKRDIDSDGFVTIDVPFAGKQDVLAPNIENMQMQWEMNVRPVTGADWPDNAYSYSEWTADIEVKSWRTGDPSTIYRLKFYPEIPNVNEPFDMVLCEGGKIAGKYAGVLIGTASAQITAPQRHPGDGHTGDLDIPHTNSRIQCWAVRASPFNKGEYIGVDNTIGVFNPDPDTPPPWDQGEGKPLKSIWWRIRPCTESEKTLVDSSEWGLESENMGDMWISERNDPALLGDLTSETYVRELYLEKLDEYGNVVSLMYHNSYTNTVIEMEKRYHAPLVKESETAGFFDYNYPERSDLKYRYPESNIQHALTTQTTQLEASGTTDDFEFTVHGSTNGILIEVCEKLRENYTTKFTYEHGDATGEGWTSLWDANPVLWKTSSTTTTDIHTQIYTVESDIPWTGCGLQREDIPLEYAPPKLRSVLGGGDQSAVRRAHFPDTGKTETYKFKYVKIYDPETTVDGLNERTVTVCNVKHLVPEPTSLTVTAGGTTDVLDILSQEKLAYDGDNDELTFSWDGNLKLTLSQENADGRLQYLSNSTDPLAPWVMNIGYIPENDPSRDLYLTVTYPPDSIHLAPYIHEYSIGTHKATFTVELDTLIVSGINALDNPNAVDHDGDEEQTITIEWDSAYNLGELNVSLVDTATNHILKENIPKSSDTISLGYSENAKELAVKIEWQFDGDEYSKLYPIGTHKATYAIKFSELKVGHDLSNLDDLLAPDHTEQDYLFGESTPLYLAWNSPISYASDYSVNLWIEDADMGMPLDYKSWSGDGKTVTAFSGTGGGQKVQLRLEITHPSGLAKYYSIGTYKIEEPWFTPTSLTVKLGSSGAEIPVIAGGGRASGWTSPTYSDHGLVNITSTTNAFSHDGSLDVGVHIKWESSHVIHREQLALFKVQYNEYGDEVYEEIVPYGNITEGGDGQLYPIGWGGPWHIEVWVHQPNSTMEPNKVRLARIGEYKAIPNTDLSVLTVNGINVLSADFEPLNQLGYANIDLSWTRDASNPDDLVVTVKDEDNTAIATVSDGAPVEVELPEGTNNLKVVSSVPGFETEYVIGTVVKWVRPDGAIRNVSISSNLPAEYDGAGTLIQNSRTMMQTVNIGNSAHSTIQQVIEVDVGSVESATTNGQFDIELSWDRLKFDDTALGWSMHARNLKTLNTENIWTNYSGVVTGAGVSGDGTTTNNVQSVNVDGSECNRYKGTLTIDAGEAIIVEIVPVDGGVYVGEKLTLQLVSRSHIPTEDSAKAAALSSTYTLNHSSSYVNLVRAYYQSSTSVSYADQNETYSLALESKKILNSVDTPVYIPNLSDDSDSTANAKSSLLVTHKSGSILSKLMIIDDSSLSSMDSTERQAAVQAIKDSEGTGSRDDPETGQFFWIRMEWDGTKWIIYPRGTWNVPDGGVFTNPGIFVQSAPAGGYQLQTDKLRGLTTLSIRFLEMFSNMKYPDKTNNIGNLTFKWWNSSHTGAIDLSGLVDVTTTGTNHNHHLGAQGTLVLFEKLSQQGIGPDDAAGRTITGILNDITHVSNPLYARIWPSGSRFPFIGVWYQQEPQRLSTTWQSATNFDETIATVHDFRARRLQIYKDPYNDRYLMRVDIWNGTYSIANGKNYGSSYDLHTAVEFKLSGDFPGTFIAGANHVVRDNGLNANDDDVMTFDNVADPEILIMSSIGGAEIDIFANPYNVTRGSPPPSTHGQLTFKKTPPLNTGEGPYVIREIQGPEDLLPNWQPHQSSIVDLPTWALDAVTTWPAPDPVPVAVELANIEILGSLDNIRASQEAGIDAMTTLNEFNPPLDDGSEMTYTYPAPIGLTGNTFRLAYIVATPTVAGSTVELEPAIEGYELHSSHSNTDTWEIVLQPGQYYPFKLKIDDKTYNMRVTYPNPVSDLLHTLRVKTHKALGGFPPEENSTHYVTLGSPGGVSSVTITTDNYYDVGGYFKIQGSNNGGYQVVIQPVVTGDSDWTETTSYSATVDSGEEAEITLTSGSLTGSINYGESNSRKYRFIIRVKFSDGRLGGEYRVELINNSVGYQHPDGGGFPTFGFPTFGFPPT